MNIQINEQLGQEQASYVAPYYTLDCTLGINSFGAPKLSPDLGAELLKEVDLYYCHSHLAELATNTACYVGTKPEQLTFTNGSLGALELIFNKLLPKEKSMLGVGPQFVEAVSEFQIAGGTYRSLNMFDYWNEDELLHALKAELKSNPPTIVYIDNPNNPTGLIYTRTTLMELCRACNEVGSILLIDEAYGEFLDVEESMIGVTAEFDNLIVLRTFSKGLGLAGIRLGYAVSSRKLAHYLNQSVLPFAPSLPAIKVANHVLCNMGTYLRDT
ncbi:aminotransferase class I/II-fold pyridoxal phosphate-dependent enzyme [Vibrio sp. SCSIO 43140]|uniref:aminotransferase class I/II-fold pyridoxal phosphate-dependent enzyme n=1 Tax=Vibrio sp. SCSIO 43140 TaxID=2819100 RepID=UPI002074D7D9|nr:aminotransferase class I/II-fold pyridoxal phosphate-dependent enzyme [Vibrio sp. SCSIO 43140]USD61336.1 aminotransferase class I/II-fold pyridoxal phosphate-dependent enzyme [Vibrio sp. SCSIO 43140]